MKSQLRGAFYKWPPKNELLKSSRVERGFYLCNGCKKKIPKSVVIKGKRHNNVYVDHIQPIVDPKVGFTDFDSFINGLYCETDNLQVLCKSCHDIKSKEERTISAIRRKKNK